MCMVTALLLVQEKRPAEQKKAHGVDKTKSMDLDLDESKEAERASKKLIDRAKQLIQIVCDNKDRVRA